MVGTDLPLKALVWEDARAQVWLAYLTEDAHCHVVSMTRCPVAVYQTSTGKVVISRMNTGRSGCREARWRQPSKRPWQD